MKKRRASPKKMAVALTWDGARWPVRRLGAKARAFLAGGKAVPAPSGMEMARFFSSDEIAELRICWVPKLAGGDSALTDPFSTSDGKRLAFSAVKTVSLGDVLGVVYRPSPRPSS
jgi:hypothetical protein